MDGVVEAGAPGAIALIRTGQRTWPEVGGLGDLHARHPACPADRFRIGSVTKSFVATVVLQLAGEGRLGLDDSLQRWLPGAVPGGENFTIWQLLNHTSGLHDYTDDLLPRLTAMPARQALRQMAARNYQPQQLVAIATSYPPLFPPGERFAYSNTNSSAPPFFQVTGAVGGVMGSLALFHKGRIMARRVIRAHPQVNCSAARRGEILHDQG